MLERLLAAYGGPDVVSDSCDRALLAYRGFRKLPVSSLATFHLITRGIDTDLANDMLDRVKSQSWSSSGDPVQSLVRLLNGGVAKKAQTELLILLFKTWNLLRRGETVTVLRWQPSREGFVFPDGASRSPRVLLPT